MSPPDGPPAGSRAGRAAGALLAGITIGATMAGGTALLLYTGQGFIRAAGLLVSSTIMAVAAGVWAGVPEAPTAASGHRRRPVSRYRWIAVILAMLAGGAFAAVWAGSPVVREHAAGGAIAVLLVLALPAYATGSLLASLNAGLTRVRGGAGGGVAAGALAGAAIGVLVATGTLIQTMEPSGIYYAAAAVLALGALFDRGAGGETRTGGTDMTGHIALITGVGARGQLGYTVARAFLDAGATVTITDLNAEVEPIADELSAYGRVVGERADLLDDGDVARLIAGVRERHGRLDSLINIAGGLTVTGTVEDTEPGKWRVEIERNAETALRMCRAALPLLREARGAVVNFTSPAARSAPAGMSAYSAAKAAVMAITRALALEEMQHGVRANAIAPGPMDTQQNRHEAGDVADTVFVGRDEVADVVLFLAGPASRGVSGQTLDVPGATLA